MDDAPMDPYAASSWDSTNEPNKSLWRKPQSERSPDTWQQPEWMPPSTSPTSYLDPAPSGNTPPLPNQARWPHQEVKPYQQQEPYIPSNQIPYPAPPAPKKSRGQRNMWIALPVIFLFMTGPAVWHMHWGWVAFMFAFVSVLSAATKRK